MAKAKSKKSNSSSLTIAQLRRQIDKADKALLAALNDRAELSRQVGELKQGSQSLAYDPAREAEIVEKLRLANKGPLTDRSVETIFREIISACRSLAVPRRAAYLGPQFSYSNLAAIERFGQAAELIPVGTIAAVFEEVLDGKADFGIVPMENSTDGRIADTLTMFALTDAQICGEVQLRIHHYLLGSGKRNEIKEVHSKPQALSQCRDWLAKHLPSARLVPSTSTTAAAEIAAKDKNIAAVASRQAGVNYGLNVLAANIEDNKNNVTRFAVIGQQPTERTKDDKTAVMFKVEHKPGSLADAMNIFKRNKLNMTWIESFPIPDAPNEYLFFVELLGHSSETKVKKAIASLETKCVRLATLGSYARTAVVDA